jgi:hypothetical protein
MTKPRCQVRGCNRPAKWAVATTLDWAPGASVALEVFACDAHTAAHEQSTGRTLTVTTTEDYEADGPAPASGGD